MIISLDQNDWIELAIAGQTARGKPVYVEMLNELRRLKAHGHSIPISIARYQETWKIGSRSRRRDLGSIVEELSGFETTWHPSICRRFELQGHLSRTGRTIPPFEAPLIGVGFGHAVGIDDFKFFGYENPTDFEREVITEVLAESQFDIFCLEPADADHALKLDAIRKKLVSDDQKYEAGQRALKVKMREHSGSSIEELERVLRAETLIQFMDEFDEWLQPFGFFGSGVLAALADQEASVVGELPSIDVLAKLRAQNFRDPGRPIPRNDYYDLITLMSTIPYVDIVSTDKAWSDLCRRASVDEQFGCFITGSAAELLEQLKSVDS